MRLAFVSIEDVEDVRSWSGIPHFMLDGLRRHGIDVDVISPLERPFKYLLAPHKVISKITRRGIQINRYPIALRNFATQIERRLEGKQFDAVFSPSSVPISRLRPGLPVLYWTDAITEGAANYYGESFGNMSAREVCISHDQEQSALNRASFAIYGSSWAAETVKRLYDNSAEKVKVIEFGANLPVDHNMKDVEKFITQRLESECVLLFIGVDWERKGGALALEAAKLLNERGIKTVLKVVGCDAPEAPFVERLGFISKSTSEGQRKIKHLLSTSTFFILPTRAEFAGIVFCEAAAFGLPSFATKTGGVEDYVKDSQTGYCLPLEATGAAYADIIANTLRKRDVYRRLSIAAFERYEQKLNWNVAISSLLRLVELAIRARA